MTDKYVSVTAEDGSTMRRRWVDKTDGTHVPEVMQMVAPSNATVNLTKVAGVDVAAEDSATTQNPLIVGGVVRKAAAPATLTEGDASRLTLTAAGALTTAIGVHVSSLELASAARTVSASSSASSVSTGGSISGMISVSAVAGTNPTLDVTMSESLDNGTTWQQVWAAARITGTGTVRIPTMLVGGLRRFDWVIGGTDTPSFTFSINVNQLGVTAPIIRSLFDRTAAVINATSIGAATAALPVEGCNQITAKILVAGLAVAATYQIQVSDDNSNWSNVGTATAVVANSQVAVIAPTGISANWARVVVISAGTGQTGSFVSLQANS